MTINYSIIIPHYNAPILLGRCLNSIPQRNDIQIIVVDDCSLQNYQIQLKLLENSLHHVQFIYSDKNCGAGAARNIGIKHAKGEWILFADADDYFSSSFIDSIDAYKSSNADIVFFNAKSEKSNNDRTNHLNYIHSLQNKDSIRHLLRYSFGEPWCKMVRSKLIQENNIAFEECFIHNDTKFSYLVGFFAKKIEMAPSIIYIVTKQPRSVSQQSSSKVLEQRAIVFAEKNNFLKTNHIKYFDWLMMAPLWDGIKTMDASFIKKYFSICGSYNFNFLFITKKFIVYIFKVLCLKFTRRPII